jgi:hypothetical protein
MTSNKIKELNSVKAGTASTNATRSFMVTDFYY